MEGILKDKKGAKEVWPRPTFTILTEADRT